MPSLRETQDHFTHALFSGDETGVEAFVLGGTLTPSARLDIYRNNVLVNYQNALRDTYPALVRLVGDEFFNGAARRYARAYPSDSGDLHDYGETFADFLLAFEPARALPYLPDMARLEWAMHRVFHAADASALGAAGFAGMDEARLPGLRMTLHPATRLLTSPYPLLQIWRICQPENSSTGAEVDLDAGGQNLLVIRRDYAVHLEETSAAEHALLTCLHAGQTLGEGVDTALQRQPDFDLGAFLTRHVMGGTFTTFQ